MGYFVRITNSTAEIPLAVQPEVLAIWKSLNDPKYNHKKQGEDSQGAKWYCCMDEDYDKTCDSVDDILNMLGFDFEVLGDGTIMVQGYVNKTGQEEHFFSSVAHLLSGRIDWEGEDGAGFSWIFDGQRLIEA